MSKPEFAGETSSCEGRAGAGAGAGPGGGGSRPAAFRDEGPSFGPVRDPDRDHFWGGYQFCYCFSGFETKKDKFLGGCCGRDE